jgi:UDP-N-acetylmuramoyl-tripeptide--D-alanyl-D-alanine ligase
VLKSQGNLNNHYGLPLQLLKLEPEHDIAVIEMGMSHAGEIKALAQIAKPDIGVVTLVAPVHLEYFDSLAGIARAKFELIESLPPRGVAVLNADDEYVSQFGRGFNGKVVTFGVRNVADVRAERIEDLGALGTEFDVLVNGQRERAKLPLLGQHNIYNALAGVAVALDRAIPLSVAVAALLSMKPTDKRGEVLEIGGAMVINDSYNSNPKALASMVDALAALPAKRRIVVAGEMLELGPAGEQLHLDSGCHMAMRKMDIVVGVRGLAKKIVEAAGTAGVLATFLETPEEAGEWLAREARPGDAILLKASRGVRLERALESWKQQIQAE